MAVKKPTGRSAGGGSPGGEPPSDPSRRSVLRGAAGLAGAGLTAGALAGAVTMPATAAAADKRPGARPGPAAQETGAGTAEPVIVHVRDARSGDMEVFAGTRQARLRDPALAARLSHAVGGE